MDSFYTITACTIKSSDAAKKSSVTVAEMEDAVKKCQRPRRWSPKEDGQKIGYGS